MGGTTGRFWRWRFIPKGCLAGPVGVVRCRPLGSGKKVFFIFGQDLKGRAIFYPMHFLHIARLSRNRVNLTFTLVFLSSCVINCDELRLAVSCVLHAHKADTIWLSIAEPD
jgi:hypothetical protein